MNEEITEDKSDGDEVVHPRMRYKVSSSLRTCWSDLTGAIMEIEMKVHNMINEYYNTIVSVAIPQYGFAKRLKLFGKKEEKLHTKN